MSGSLWHQPHGDRAGQDFLTTRWSVVRAAGGEVTQHGQQALSSLCEAYWLPLYAYARRQTKSVDEAQDLTQAFFVELLETNTLWAATPERGRFRAYLLTAFRHFMSKQWRKQRTQKRGGGWQQLSLDFQAAENLLVLPASGTATAEQIYERHWAVSLLDKILNQLRSEWQQEGRAEAFDAVKNCLLGERTDKPYPQLAADLGMSVGGVKMMVHRLRGRYRDLLRQEIAGTVAGPEQVDEELNWLLTVLTS